MSSWDNFEDILQLEVDFLSIKLAIDNYKVIQHTYPIPLSFLWGQFLTLVPRFWKISIWKIELCRLMEIIILGFVVILQLRPQHLIRQNIIVRTKFMKQPYSILISLVSTLSILACFFDFFDLKECPPLRPNPKHSRLNRYLFLFKFLGDSVARELCC